LSKKQCIVKELALNILELNSYRTRTEQLDNELRKFNECLENKSNSGDEYKSINQKTEVNKIIVKL
jgi:hypothetical protein